MIISQSLVASQGYYIHQAEATVFSIEELAYICVYKGYTLDKDFACRRLVQWIDEQCGCEDLAYRLSAVLKEKGGEAAFIENILRFVGYISESRIKRILQDISEGLGLSGLERKKQEADQLYREKRYVQAQSAYEELIKLLPEGEAALKAACYFNLAASRAQLFLYEQALDALELSYKLDPAEDTLFAWLATARLQYSEKQYLDILSSREDLFQLSLKLEEKIKDIEASVIRTKEGQELEKLREWMQYGGEDGYYVASGRTLHTLCEEYKRFYD